MEQDLISIMMPAYNAEDYISQAIDSVVQQSYPKWELIIVDDGSTDQSAEIAGAYTDPRIKLLSQSNGGEAAARNTALENMQGDYLSFLDADDIYLNNHLETTFGYLHANHHRDGVYTNGYYCDEKGRPIQTLQSWRRGPYEGNVFEEVVRSSDVFGPPVCVVLKRDLIKNHDLRFDPSIIIGPDWDFFTRFSAYADFGYINEITCCYRVHQTNITTRTESNRKALDIATCRMKAIKLEKFHACSVDTKNAVFYDLLVNHLNGYPERQSEIILWDEFKSLPKIIQAKLLRLMASKLILVDGQTHYVKSWIIKSRQLNPSDLHTLLISSLYNIRPRLCKRVLQLKGISILKASNESPFVKKK